MNISPVPLVTVVPSFSGHRFWRFILIVRFDSTMMPVYIAYLEIIFVTKRLGYDGIYLHLCICILYPLMYFVGVNKIFCLDQCFGLNINDHKTKYQYITSS